MLNFFKIFGSLSPGDFKRKRFFLDETVHNYSEKIDENKIQYSTTLIIKRIKTDDSISYKVKYPDEGIFSGIKFSKKDKCIITSICVKTKSSTLPSKARLSINLKQMGVPDPIKIPVDIKANEKSYDIYEQVYVSALPSSQISKLIARESFLNYLPTDEVDDVEINLKDAVDVKTKFFFNRWVVKKSTFWPTVLYIHGNELHKKYNKEEEGFDFNLYKVKTDCSLCTISNSIVKILRSEMNDKYFSKMKYIQLFPEKKFNTVQLELDTNDLDKDIYVCVVALEIKYIKANPEKLKLERHKFIQRLGMNYL